MLTEIELPYCCIACQNGNAEMHLADGEILSTLKKFLGGMTYEHIMDNNSNFICTMCRIKLIDFENFKNVCLRTMSALDVFIQEQQLPTILPTIVKEEPAENEFEEEYQEIFLDSIPKSLKPTVTLHRLPEIPQKIVENPSNTTTTTATKKRGRPKKYKCAKPTISDIVNRMKGQTTPESTTKTSVCCPIHPSRSPPQEIQQKSHSLTIVHVETQQPTNKPEDTSCEVQNQKKTGTKIDLQVLWNSGKQLVPLVRRLELPVDLPTSLPPPSSPLKEVTINVKKRRGRPSKILSQNSDRIRKKYIKKKYFKGIFYLRSNNNKKTKEVTNPLEALENKTDKEEKVNNNLPEKFQSHSSNSNPESLQTTSQVEAKDPPKVVNKSHKKKHRKPYNPWMKISK